MHIRNRAKARRGGGVVVVLAAAMLLYGCAAMRGIPKPEELVLPQPIEDASGKYPFAFRQDGTVAGWARQSALAKVGAGVGKGGAEMAGNVATNLGIAAAGRLPGIGGLLGSATAETVGKQAKRKAQHAIDVAAMGGWDNIRATSDLSFNSLGDYAVYLYAKHSSHPKYAEALAASKKLYPDLEDSYENLLRSATRR